MKSSALWVLGGFAMLLVVFGLAWNWSQIFEPKEADVAGGVADVNSEAVTTRTRVEVLPSVGKSGTELYRSFTQKGDVVRDVYEAVDVATGMTSVVGTVARDGDNVTVARGNTAFALAFNRVDASLPASSVTMSDDSTTQITLSGSWDVPDVMLDAKQTFFSPTMLFFSLGGLNGSSSRAMYQYDPTATERFSLIP